MSSKPVFVMYLQARIYQAATNCTYIWRWWWWNWGARNHWSSEQFTAMWCCSYSCSCTRKQQWKDVFVVAQTIWEDQNARCSFNKRASTETFFWIYVWLVNCFSWQEYLLQFANNFLCHRQHKTYTAQVWKDVFYFEISVWYCHWSMMSIKNNCHGVDISGLFYCK